MPIRYKIQKQNLLGQDIYIGRVQIKGAFDRNMVTLCAMIVVTPY
jgi:hypothetical protein